MVWSVPQNIWKGGDVWVIGGGPSIIQQFGIPNRIVRQVRENKCDLSAYSPYMEFLHDKHTIGVNTAFLLGTWIDFMFFGDNGFLLRFKDQLLSFKKPVISCNALAKKYSWIKYLPMENKRPFGISANPNTVCWNLNSGYASISIAANMGAKRIFLLGFDMKLGEGDQKHWHNKYPVDETQISLPKDKRVVRMPPFTRQMRGSKQIEVDAKKRGIEIINLNPDSAIESFYKANLKDYM